MTREEGLPKVAALDEIYSKVKMLPSPSLIIGKHETPLPGAVAVTDVLALLTRYMR